MDHYGACRIHAVSSFSSSSRRRASTRSRPRVRFTQFYAGNSVCTPSRAVLLSGRYGARQVLPDTFSGVYWPFSTMGMDTEQITLAEILQTLELEDQPELTGRY